MKLEDLPQGERAELEALGWEMADHLERSDLDPSTAVPEPPLAKLRRLRYQRTYAEKEAAEAVGRARAEGLSWERIGGAYGITGETARKRYQARAA
ncbi:MAG: hypothetical protein LBC97_16640 [Bifidobacteriaceae bacterium]|jgi:hypothetical protein|nr:hypothetical protein [Bifidobacteriaceae bacterium]